MTPVEKLLHDTENKMKKTIEAIEHEFATIRTGRASTTIVEGIKVECYGTHTPLKQLATLSSPEPRLIVVQPWDHSIISDIEKAILKSALGITPNNDGRVIRLTFPQLTEQRRNELAKVLKGMAEEGRVSLRNARRDANEALKDLEKKGTIPEDIKFKSQDDVQKLTDKYGNKIEEIVTHKEKEIKEI